MSVAGPIDPICFLLSQRVCLSVFHCQPSNFPTDRSKVVAGLLCASVVSNVAFVLS